MTLSLRMGVAATIGLIGALLGPPCRADEAPRTAARSPIDLSLYARLLEAHTREVPDLAGTRVDYAGLVDSADWGQLVAQLASARPEGLDRDARLAFWINAYNVLAIEIVRRHYPVGGIKEIGSFFSPVWKRDILRIEGRPISLDHVEHEILRPMGDFRIHSAIVCASTSCPSLARRPFRPEAIDADLDASMRRWLADRGKGLSIDRERRVIRLSRIFDWFEEDFEAAGGPLRAVEPYLDPPRADLLRSVGAGGLVRFFDYDWALNDLATAADP